MVTPSELASMLREVNVEVVARAAGVSTKTVYRLRHQQHVPNMATVIKLLDAIKAGHGLAAKHEQASGDVACD
jgi:DNA-binding phage protein